MNYFNLNMLYLSPTSNDKSLEREKKEGNAYKILDALINIMFVFHYAFSIIFQHFLIQI